MRELASEVRLIRAETRRISLNANRSRVVLERIRIQQEQVAQIIHEIRDIRDRLDEMRGQKLKAKQLIEKWTREKNAGLTDDESVKAFSEAAEELERREQSLVRTESRLASELSIAEANLAALNNRLDQIELDMAQPLPGADVMPVKPKQ